MKKCALSGIHAYQVPVQDIDYSFCCPHPKIPCSQQLNLVTLPNSWHFQQLAGGNFKYMWLLTGQQMSWWEMTGASVSGHSLPYVKLRHRQHLPLPLIAYIRKPQLPSLIEPLLIPTSKFLFLRPSRQRCIEGLVMAFLHRTAPLFNHSPVNSEEEIFCPL